MVEQSTTDVVDPPTPPDAPPVPRGDRAQAQAIVSRYIKWSAAGAAVPLPLIDLAAIAAVQVRMLLKLAEHYGVPLSRSRAEAAITTVTASVAPYAMGVAASRATTRWLPGVGWLTGLLVTGSAAAAATHTMGRLFIDHFEAGGTAADLEAVAEAETPAP